MQRLKSQLGERNTQSEQMRTQLSQLLEYEQKVIILANELDRVNQALKLKTDECEDVRR